MANYVLEKNIDIGYELWKRGYRINRRTYSETQFVDTLNRVNETHDYEVPFECVFEAIKMLHPEYLIDEVAEAEEYKRENEPKIREYFQKYFADKTSKEISEDEELCERWDGYSDWHKDVFGYRPHGIVCGVYINPHTGRREEW